MLWLDVLWHCQHGGGGRAVIRASEGASTGRSSEHTLELAAEKRGEAGKRRRRCAPARGVTATQPAPRSRWLWNRAGVSWPARPVRTGRQVGTAAGARWQCGHSAVLEGGARPGGRTAARPGQSSRAVREAPGGCRPSPAAPVLPQRGNTLLGLLRQRAKPQDQAAAPPETTRLPSSAGAVFSLAGIGKTVQRDSQQVCPESPKET